MNRSKRFLNKNVEKKLRKEVRNAPRLPTKEEKVRTDRLKEEDLLKKFPKKVAQKQKSIVKPFMERIRVKKAKKRVKISKRTTPGLVDAESPPRSIHIEGERWVKTLQKQTLAKNKIQAKKGFRK